MHIEETKLKGVFRVSPRRFADARGFFSETWNAAGLAAAGLEITFVQDNQSLSRAAGTIRGLHFQTPPHAQAKLVRCGRGALLDVAVDLRRGSPSFGDWVAEELSAENGRQLLIPEGFAHGFVTLQPDTEILYKCSAYYSPQHDAALMFDDPDLGIDWGLSRAEAVLSDKDAAAPPLVDLAVPFVWQDGA